MRLETIKILEENTGSNLFDMGCSNIFLDMSPEARKTKAKINYWDLKINSFCTVKETISKSKRESMEWEKIFANDIYDEVLVSKIYKELTKLNTPKTNNPVKKCTEGIHRNFSKEDIQMANRHMKRCSTSLTIREIQIKTTMRYHLTPVRLAKINNVGNNRCWQRCGERESIALLVGMKTGAATLENSTEFLQRVKNRTTLQSSNCTTRYLSKGYKNTDSKGCMLPMFIAALSIIAKVQKKPKCPLTDDEWIKKMWYINIME